MMNYSNKISILAIIALIFTLTSCQSSKDSNKKSCDSGVCITEENSAFAPRKTPKKVWADEYLYNEMPKINITTWLNDKKPDFANKDKNKIVLYCIWTTWCPRCREFNERMNEFAVKYKDDLVIIAISNETVEAIANKYWQDARDIANNNAGVIKATDFKYYVAQDPNIRKQFNVTGVPHVIIAEKDNIVVWEGNPNDPTHGLKEDILKKIIEINKAE